MPKLSSELRPCVSLRPASLLTEVAAETRHRLAAGRHANAPRAKAGHSGPECFHPFAFVRTGSKVGAAATARLESIELPPVRIADAPGLPRQDGRRARHPRCTRFAGLIVRTRTMATAICSRLPMTSARCACVSWGCARPRGIVHQTWPALSTESRDRRRKSNCTFVAIANVT